MGSSTVSGWVRVVCQANHPSKEKRLVAEVYFLVAVLEAGTAKTERRLTQRE